MTMGKRILIIDDDEDVLNIYTACFRDTDFVIDTAGDGIIGLQKLKSFRPDLIILDIMMPGMNGYGFCEGFIKQEGDITTPIIFASAEQDNDRANAFSYGVVDYLVKPFRKTDLLVSISRNIGTGDRWKTFMEKAAAAKDAPGPDSFGEFAGFLAGKTGTGAAGKERLLGAGPAGFYAEASRLNIRPDITAQTLAEFYNMRYLPVVDPETVSLGFLPIVFLHKNKTVLVNDPSGGACFVTAEPFNEGFTGLLKFAAGHPFCVTEQENIELLFNRDRNDSGVPGGSFRIEGAEKAAGSRDKWESAALIKLSNVLIAKALFSGEKSVAIEPRNPMADIRLGSQRPFAVMAKTGLSLILRYKIISGMDIVDNLRPQKGAFTVEFNGRKYAIEASTVPSPSGERCSLAISGV